MRKILLFFIILFGSIDAICCSCYHKGLVTVEDFNSYEWIFIGTLISEHHSEEGDYNYRRIAVYKVIVAYKGVSRGDTVEVYDAEDMGACGLGKLYIGRGYLIYATGKEKKLTFDCARTTRVPLHIWPRDSAVINKLKNLTSFGRIYDTAHTNFHADTLFLNQHVLKIHKNAIRKFYDGHGNISAYGRYKNGNPEGFWKYFENGEITSKGRYNNGKKDSLWVEPFEKEMIYIREYKEGEFTYKEKVFYNGKITSKQEPVENGEKWVKYAYHSNGRVRNMAYATPPQRDQNNRLMEAVLNGLSKTFNKSGTLLAAGEHKDGFNIGHWKYYYENGKLRMEGDYTKGEKSGIWKIYYPDSKTKATGLYENDEKSGIWKFFDEKGGEILSDPELIKEDEDWFTYSGVKS